MSNRIKFNDDLTVGAQPSQSDIQQLADEGFKSVINFRTDGEEDQPLSPDAERDEVAAAGMQYLHAPVSMDSIDHSTVDQFRLQFESMPKPAFVHCKSGKRAGAMIMMHVAAEKGMTGEEALKQAEEMGFECDVPELEEFVKSYVDQRSPATA